MANQKQHHYVPRFYLDRFTDPIAEALAQGLAHAPQQADRLVGEEGLGLGPADHSEAARLVPVRGDLGEELVVAEPGPRAAAVRRITLRVRV